MHVVTLVGDASNALYSFAVLTYPQPPCVQIASLAAQKCDWTYFAAFS
jgi:hypothetical protein